MTGESLNRLLRLTGESLAESRWFHPFAGSLLDLKRMQTDLMQTLDHLRDFIARPRTFRRARMIAQTKAIEQAMECRRFLADRLVDLDMFDRRSASLSHRLYQEVLQCRMRPFGDGLRRIPRMARDLARLLDKEIRLEIVGENILVDSEMLENLEIPLVHLLRNAADHGCEFPGGAPTRGQSRRMHYPVGGKTHSGNAPDNRGRRWPRCSALDLLRETIARIGPGRSRMLVEKMSETDLLEISAAPRFYLEKHHYRNLRPRRWA